MMVAFVRVFPGYGAGDAQALRASYCTDFLRYLQCFGMQWCSLFY